MNAILMLSLSFLVVLSAQAKLPDGFVGEAKLFGKDSESGCASRIPAGLAGVANVKTKMSDYIQVAALGDVIPLTENQKIKKYNDLICKKARLIWPQFIEAMNMLSISPYNALSKVRCSYKNIKGKETSNHILNMVAYRSTTSDMFTNDAVNYLEDNNKSEVLLALLKGEEGKDNLFVDMIGAYDAFETEPKLRDNILDMFKKLCGVAKKHQDKTKLYSDYCVEGA